MVKVIDEEEYATLLARLEENAARLRALEQTILRMQGKASSTVKMDVAAKILMCSPSQVRNYVSWGVFPEGKYDKAGHAPNSPLVFDLDFLNYLKDNRHLLRRPASA